MSTGLLSAAPDVSDKEAKAARLDRYAELQWSLDTSPKAFSQGYLTSPTQEVYRLADEVWNPVK